MASILSAGTTTATSMVHTADTSGVLQLASNNGTVAVTIGTNQYVGINTASPASLLTVNNTGGGTGIRLTGSGTATQYIDITSTGGDLTLGLDNSVGGLTGYAYGAVVGSYANTALSFVTNSVVRGVFDTSGNLLINTSNGGIRFSNSSALTNSTLNDYETGTFTPTLFGTGATSGVTYSAQQGTYTKIGNMVTVWVNLTLTSKGSISGYLKINLPFTGSGNPSSEAYMIGSGWTLNSNGYLANAYQYGGNTFVYLIAQNYQSYYQMVSSDITGSGTNFQFSLTYPATF